MRLSLDGRSLAVGAFAGAALVAGIGAGQNAPRRPAGSKSRRRAVPAGRPVMSWIR